MIRLCYIRLHWDRLEWVKSELLLSGLKERILPCCELPVGSYGMWVPLGAEGPLADS